MEVQRLVLKQGQLMMDVLV